MYMWKFEFPNISLHCHDLSRALTWQSAGFTVQLIYTTDTARWWMIFLYQDPVRGSNGMRRETLWQSYRFLRILTTKLWNAHFLFIVVRLIIVICGIYIVMANC